MSTTTFSIDDRFQGFPGYALGGITGGLMAQRIGPEAEVTLHQPIRTGDELEMRTRDSTVELLFDGDTVATAKSTTIDVEIADTVLPESAMEASESYVGFHEHPYPSCFTCGTERSDGEGLRIFPGPVGTEAIVAGPWTPHPNQADSDGTVPLEYVWAAVDCPSIWAVMEAAPSECPDHVVTGRLAVRSEEPIRETEPHVVMAWPLERRSNTWPAAAAIVDADGRVKAVARHTLVLTDWGVPLSVSRTDD
ncbi:hypothetical protein [Saliphagus infecundisoli]|uniref:Thioesterase family protein n=1 Tax=Saliphagus infecundisoli TaxID=1849069 RepID=A0ABD5Q929_9EURY|nr:hypothetical protein [Saliphagus infecundisoli]